MLTSASVESVHTWLARGSGRTRDVYAGARALARARSYLPRRAAARRIDTVCVPEIPEADGFRVLAPYAVPGIESVVRSARALRRETDTELLWTRSQGRNLLRVPLEDRLDRQPEWLALALDPTVLSAVSRYLGSVPLLRGMQMWISPHATHSPDGRPLEWRYHCDWADIRQVRVLVFVDDVTPERGPLTMISARRSADVRRARDYTFRGTSFTMLDDELFEHVDPSEQHALTGAAGTLAFADTCRCFHQGSRVLRPGTERLMVMFQYLTVTGFKLPSSFADRSPFARFVTDEHSDLQRLVLGVR